MKRFNFKLFFVLLFVGLVAAAAVLPYVFTSVGLMDASGNTIEGLSANSLPILAVVQIAQMAIILAATIALGIVASKAVGLGLPFVAPMLAGKKPAKHFGESVLFAVLLGMILSFAILVVDALAFRTAIGTSLAETAQQSPLWMRALATFYGAIDEELLMRFFLLSVLAWFFSWAHKKRKPSLFGLWASIILTAAIFSVGHLPFAQASASTDVRMIVRSLILDGAAGVLFGWLYVRRGLESAIIAHFASDVMLLLVLPVLVRLV